MKFCFEKRDFIELDIRPEALALAGSDRDLSWSEFKVEVDQWHTAFVAKSWTKLGGPVIIYGHKNTTMVAAIYGCIRAGIPYIPIDVVYPKDRIASIIDISKSQIIINTEAEKLGLGAMIEVASPRDITEHVGEVILDNNPNPNKLVYIIFTSGSTGAPKGVQISLEAILSFVRWMTSDFGFKEGSVFINSAIFSFDLSVFELMTFSALGGTLLMNTKEQAANPQTFLQRIHDYQGNIWVSTPSFALLFSKMPPATQL
ncbi:MAG: D-alanine--poly(phosphoribitol) ligase subunit 1, partial [Sphingobacteriales bacterium]